MCWGCVSVAVLSSELCLCSGEGANGEVESEDVVGPLPSPDSFAPLMSTPTGGLSGAPPGYDKYRMRSVSWERPPTIADTIDIGKQRSVTPDREKVGTCVCVCSLACIRKLLCS